MTLYTSGKSLKTNIIFSLAATIFFAVFGGIYEYFGHDIYSFYMIYAFMIPLLFGLLPYIIMLFKKIEIKKTAAKWWNLTIITFTLYSVIKGVLEIYGTTNKLSIVYLFLGLIALIITIFYFVKEKQQDK